MSEDKWPSEPPEPADFSTHIDRTRLPVRRCPYCLDLFDAEYHGHDCPERETCVQYSFPNDQFGIVVPGETGWVWGNKTMGHAIGHVHVQGTLIPLGEIRKRVPVDKEERHELRSEIRERFEEFEDPEAAHRHYLRGLRDSPEHEYGGVPLGAKLVEEMLDGVYADDEGERIKKRETRAERVNAVWDEIDAELPFAYERVAAPKGHPPTQEGLRWIDVTGQSERIADDMVLSATNGWVDHLAALDTPVAFFYPNSD